MMSEAKNHRTEEPLKDIFAMSFKGQVPLQTGEYTVCAHQLNSKDELIGGGIVADFSNAEDAQTCYQSIVEANPAHAPEIWHKKEKLIRSYAEEAYQTRQKTTRALLEGRVVRRKK